MSKNNVNILAINRPHPKLEGVQKINKEDIKKMLEKADKMGQKSGEFKKIQVYEFHVDEYEDMNPVAQKKAETAKKNTKKETKAQKQPNDKPKKQQAKKKPSSDEEEEEEEEEEVKPVKYKAPSNLQNLNKAQVPKKKEQMKKKEEKEEKEQEEGEEEGEEKEEEEQVDDQKKRVPVLMKTQSKLSEPDYEDMKRMEEEAMEEEEKVSVSQKNSSGNYRSSMARQMEEMLQEDDGKVEEEDEQSEFEKEQSKYLRTIKQYQLKISALNEQLNQKKELTVIKEEREEREEKEERREVQKERSPPRLKFSVYDEFKQNELVEEQMRLIMEKEQKKMEEQERLLEEQKRRMEAMQLEYERQMAEMQQKHQSDLKNMQRKVQRYEQYAAEALDTRKQHRQQPENLSFISSNISDVIDESEQKAIQNDPHFYSINTEQLVEEARDDNELDLNDSPIDHLRSDHFQQSEIHLADSDLMQHPEQFSISNLGESEISDLSSNIDSLITEHEQQKLQEQINKNYHKIPYDVADSSLDDVLNADDKLEVFNDNFSQVSSNVGDVLNRKKKKNKFNDVNSDITDVIGTDSELGFEYLKQTKQKLQQREKVVPPEQLEKEQRMDIDSDIDELLSRGEMKSLAGRLNEVDSQLSINDVLNVEEAVKLVEQPKQKMRANFNAMNSDIDSLISSEEQRELKCDPRFEYMQIDDDVRMDVSDIDSIISKKEQYWESVSDLRDSFYERLAEQLEKDYRIPRADKLEIYRRIARRAKKQYEDQLKLQMVRNQPKKVSTKLKGFNPPKIEKSNLARQSISRRSNKTGNSNSSLGSVMSKSEQEKMKKCKEFQTMNSNVSGLSALNKINSSIGSVMSKQSQQILQHDPRFSKMDSRDLKINNSESKNRENSSIGSVISKQSQYLLQNDTQFSKMDSEISQKSNSIASYLSYKSHLKNQLMELQKAEEQPPQSFEQKYQNYVDIKTRQSQLQEVGVIHSLIHNQMNSSISGLVSNESNNQLKNINSDISDL